MLALVKPAMIPCRLRATILRSVFRRISDRLAEAKEVRKLGRLLREVEAPSTPESTFADLKAVFTGGRTKDDALDELVAFLTAREGIAQVLKRYELPGISADERLKGLYWKLIASGAGQRIAGRYVATAGLYDPRLLAYLLKSEGEDGNKLPLGVLALRFVEGRA